MPAIYNYYWPVVNQMVYWKVVLMWSPAMAYPAVMALNYFAMLTICLNLPNQMVDRWIGEQRRATMDSNPMETVDKNETNKLLLFFFFVFFATELCDCCC